MRVASLAAAEGGHAAPFVLAASRLAFCGGFDLDDPEVLAEAAAAAGLGLPEVLAAAGDRSRDGEMEATALRLLPHGRRPTAGPARRAHAVLRRGPDRRGRRGGPPPPRVERPTRGPQRRLMRRDRAGSPPRCSRCRGDWRSPASRCGRGRAGRRAAGQRPPPAAVRPHDDRRPVPDRRRADARRALLLDRSAPAAACNDIRIVNVRTGKVVQTMQLPGASGGIAMDRRRSLAYISGVHDSELRRPEDARRHARQGRRRHPRLLLRRRRPRELREGHPGAAAVGRADAAELPADEHARRSPGPTGWRSRPTARCCSCR